VSLPRVTVLLAVYNGEPHLGDAIRSVLSQTYREFQLLIVDDASTDASPATIASFEDPRIRVIRNDVNLGLTRSLNRGLALIDSEYVARLDADDLAFPERLEKQVAFLDAHPDVAVVGSQGIPIDARGRRLRRVEQWHREWQRPRDGAAFEWYRMFDTPFIHSSVMFRRSIICEQLGGYDQTILLGQDEELWLRVAKVARMVNLDERLVAMRLTPRSITGDPEKNERPGTREQKVSVRHRAMCDVLPSADGSRGCAETWVDVVHPGAAVSPARIRTLLYYVEQMARQFAETKEIRRHRGSMLARMAEKAAPSSRALSLALMLRFLQLDPVGALLFVPRFLLVFLAGDRPLHWLRARRRAGGD
jgi:glycosyltransferase involved in cell wall biosynthesis